MMIAALARVAVGLVLLSQAGAAQPGAPAVGLRDIHNIYVEEPTKAGDAGDALRSCLIKEITADQRFTIVDSSDRADATLRSSATLPGGAGRVLGGRSPSISAELVTTGGTVAWAGTNRYKKSTTVWGASSDINCGLAHGLVSKFETAVKAADNKASTGGHR